MTDDSLVLFRRGPIRRIPVRVSQMVARQLAIQAEQTQIAYRRVLQHFADFTGCKSMEDAIDRLIQTPTEIAQDVVLAFQECLIRLELAPATINRRMSALRSVLKLARAVGATTLRLDMIKNLDPELETRDVRGPGIKVIRHLIAVAEEDTGPTGLRDATLMRWLVATGIRRNELRLILLSDFRHGDQVPEGDRMLGDGVVAVRQKRKRKKHPMGLSAPLVRCTLPWIERRGDVPGALFCSLDRRSAPGAVRAPVGLNKILLRGAIAAGYPEGKLPDGRSITPHGFRHTAITEVIRKHGQAAAQAFARHADPRTTALYNDEAQQMALEAQAFVFESL